MLRIRRVDSPTWRDRVYALRYRAYRRADAIPASPSERFSDTFDQQPNHILWALTDGDSVVGSIRVTWHEPGSELLIPEQVGYASAIQAVVAPQARLFAGNRFVTDIEGDAIRPQMAILLLKYLVLTSIEGGCDWALAAVRAHHLPFYRRVLRLKQVSEARNYPGLVAPMYLTACHFPHEIERVYCSQPLLRPTAQDRVMLDEDCSDRWEHGLPITGRLAGLAEDSGPAAVALASHVGR
jgi:hypothetical protein